ncbi:hypothetical protein T265_01288 [Opisthorchis viverrini]|uniref:Uncharacterized protein n=1 Tax=Opisthorchis viverrini TaxID=6198 RepID=A0A075A2X3_OPIVI|nr:hypothetical protein T265_01288 [Opisthorchis viverrini]KER32597.1 hypothetical protein T265_01288 [Opisthorchis viverrini]
MHSALFNSHTYVRLVQIILCLLRPEGIWAQQNANQDGGLDPVVQGVLMGLGLFVALLGLIIFLICCCCRNDDNSTRSLARLSLTPKAAEDTKAVGAYVGPAAEANQQPSTSSKTMDQNKNRDAEVNLYATSGQSLPSYAKPVVKK